MHGCRQDCRIGIRNVVAVGYPEPNPAKMGRLGL